MRPQRRIFLFSENNRYICSVLRLNAEDKHIFDESVLAFILEWKSGKFTLAKESITLVTPYCLIWGVLYPILNTSVGYCLFGQRYSRTSIQID